MDLTSLKHTVVRKPGKRGATLTITRDGEVLVTVPKNFSQSMIHQMLHQHAAWIEKKLLANEAMRTKYPRKNYLPGDKFPFLGKNYHLELIEAAKRRIELSENSLKVYAAPEEMYGEGEDNIASMVQAWYEASAARILKDRVLLYEEKMRVKGGTIEVKTVNSFWGSCAQDGYLRFNARLLMAPIEVVDYVIVHELSHLTHRNHSRAFWREVETVLPDYKIKRRWLSRHGHFLTF